MSLIVGCPLDCCGEGVALAGHGIRVAQLGQDRPDYDAGVDPSEAGGGLGVTVTPKEPRNRRLCPRPDEVNVYLGNM